MAGLRPGLFDVSGMLPSITQGFKALGGLPEAINKRGMFEQIVQAQLSGNPEDMAAAAANAVKVDPRLGVELAGQVRTARENQRLQNAQAGIGYLQNQMQSVLRDKSLSPQEQEAKLKNLQESANAIGREVPGLNPAAIANLRMQSEKDVFALDESKRQSERADQQLDMQFKRLGLAEDEAARASARHKEWMDTANYRTNMRKLEQESAEYSRAAQVASGFVGQANGKENFIKAVGDEKFAGLYDALEDQRKTRKAQLDRINQDIEEGKFKFTDEEIRDVFKLDADADISQFEAIAKSDPKAANRFMLAQVQKNFTTAGPPDKAYINMFMDLAREKADDWYPNLDETIERESLKMAGAAAEVYAKTGDISQALAAMTAASGETESSENPMAAAVKEVQSMVSTLIKQQQDAIDY